MYFQQWGTLQHRRRKKWAILDSSTAQCRTVWPPCRVKMIGKHNKHKPQTKTYMKVDMYQTLPCLRNITAFHSLYHAAKLTPTARVPCSNVANIGECKTWSQSEFCTWQTSVRGKNPRKLPAHPGDCQTCKVWLTSVERRRCSKDHIPLRYPGRRPGLRPGRRPVASWNLAYFTLSS